MSIGVFLAAMVVALLHAGWNATIKLGTNKDISMQILACVVLTRL
ncbi:hypothetical protein [Palleronia sp. THAF1]|nr:hypothetical protein [Palleronia sp. THAF1]